MQYNYVYDILGGTPEQYSVSNGYFEVDDIDFRTLETKPFFVLPVTNPATVEVYTRVKTQAGEIRATLTNDLYGAYTNAFQPVIYDTNTAFVLRFETNTTAAAFKRR
jgi:hypothetical protein